MSDKDECQYCDGMGDCPAISGHDGFGFFCIREAGHKGPHVACSGTEHPIAWWNDGDEDVSAPPVPADSEAT